MTDPRWQTQFLVDQSQAVEVATDRRLCADPHNNVSLQGELSVVDALGKSRMKHHMLHNQKRTGSRFSTNFWGRNVPAFWGKFINYYKIYTNLGGSLSLGMSGWMASPLPSGLIFPPTVYINFTCEFTRNVTWHKTHEISSELDGICTFNLWVGKSNTR